MEETSKMFGKGMVEKIVAEVVPKVEEQIMEGYKKVTKIRDKEIADKMIEIGDKYDEMLEKKCNEKLAKLQEMMEGYEERIETYAREVVEDLKK